MNPDYDKLLDCYKIAGSRVSFKPRVALVLGSGLGDYADEIDVREILDYHDIDGFPISTVPGHKGRFVFGYVDHTPVVCMQGRVHYYEGYNIKDVVLPARLMKLMGAETLFLTNASGGINYNFKAGDFMLIRDHITNFVPSPLIGPNMDDLGPRFADMSHVYDEDLQKLIRDAAVEERIPLKEGVYIQLTGPNFETPAEIRMCRALGADAVGMSTAVEAMAAKHMRMKVCGISCVTNLAAGMSVNPLSHQEVQETADRVAPLFKRLVTAAIRKM